MARERNAPTERHRGLGISMDDATIDAKPRTDCERRVDVRSERAQRLWEGAAAALRCGDKDAAYELLTEIGVRP